MVLSSILNPVNSSIMAVALVPIGRAFGAPPSRTAWLVSALYLATAIGQPVFGRMVDVLGPRRLLLAGASLTCLAGVLGMTARSLLMLIGARVLLGFGTCAGYPASMTLIRQESDRIGLTSPAGVLAVLAVANQTIAVIGPSIGGLLIHLGTWRWVFAINVPLGVASGLAAWLLVPASTRSTQPGWLAKLDLIGIALFAGAMTSALIFLMTPGADTVALAALAVIMAAAFTWRELRTHAPFIDLRVLRGNVALLATFARTLLAMTVSYCFLYGYTQWLEDAHGESPAEAGLLLMPMSAVAIGVSALAGRRGVVRGKLLIGAGAQLLGCGLLLALTADTATWALVAVAVVFGVPQGLLSLAVQNSLYAQADPERIGSSAGLLRTFGYLGAIASATLTATLFGDTASTTGLYEIASVLLVICTIFLAITIGDRSLSRIGHDS